MRVAVIGGGPGGLYLASLLKGLDRSHDITVWERNAAEDTFGFGVVFSDETLGGIEHADRVIHDSMAASFARWDDIDVHYRGTVVTSGGHGFAAMRRHRLLEILQQRAIELGVTVNFSQLAPASFDGYDLVVASDGANSATRARHADVFRPRLDGRHARYMWLGTPLVFEAFKFYVVETEFGIFQIHGYPYDATMSTFIVETTEAAWRAAGFEASAGLSYAPGESDLDSVRRCEKLFADVLDGHPLVPNASRWITFNTVRNESWRHGNLVLLGDAAHTAHFSIGSGTKLAMEDALALAACLAEHSTVDAALTAYETERRPVVESTQRSAQASLEWFEVLGQYAHQEPEQFAFNLLTRSRRVTYDNLKLRDPEFVERMDTWFAESEVARGAAPPPAVVRPPMFTPFRLRDLVLPNRIVVSAMDMYSAVDGLIGDFHLVHLGSKALGGAGLVMTEMVCVSPEGRITPGCAGLWTSQHEAAYARLVAFVHGSSPSAVGLQLGHSGRKGSTKLMWEGIDQPLESGNWPVMGPSPLPYDVANQVPREMSREDMDLVTAQFVAAAEAGARAGFDLLELHCGHGYLLSSFLTPVSNSRTDAYGGSLENRLRFPLEVFDGIRAVWPEERPISVRISATDWVENGLDTPDAVAIARAFAEHGADLIDVSTGQTTPLAQPVFGRSFQTPFADAIRNSVRVATMAVGAISSYDDVNSILLAGRADLCALGRTHLYDPSWTLHAAADQGYPVPWPLPYAAGSRKPAGGRSEDPRPRLSLARGEVAGTRHGRWRP